MCPPPSGSNGAPFGTLQVVTAIRLAAPNDVEAMSGALARAFADDPVMTWMFPSEDFRSKRLPKMFRAMLVHICLPRGEVYTTSEVSGAAMWVPPGTWPFGRLEQLRLLPSTMGGLGRRMITAARFELMLESKHPREPHWYLSVLGTDPAHQGRGVGSGLLRPVLERCDTEGLPAYLESSKEQNIAFYARHGFDVTGELSIDGTPSVWAMWRPPR